MDKFPTGALMNKGLTIRTGQCHVQRYLKPLYERIRNGDIDPSFVVTHRLRARQGARRLRDLQAQAGRVREGRPQALKGGPEMPLPPRPVDATLHGVVDYTAGALLMTAFPKAGRHRGHALGHARSGAAGAIHAGYSTLTDYPLGVVKVLPFQAHLALDALGAVALAATPFVTGQFRKGRRHWVPHVALCLFELASLALTDPTGRGRLPRRRRGGARGQHGGPAPQDLQRRASGGPGLISRDPLIRGQGPSALRWLGPGTGRRNANRSQHSGLLLPACVEVHRSGHVMLPRRTASTARSPPAMAAGDADSRPAGSRLARPGASAFPTSRGTRRVSARASRSEPWAVGACAGPGT